jgi:hypothetical protein
MSRSLPSLEPGQDWCCGGCGSGIVDTPRRSDFEYSREEFPDGRVISMTMLQYVAPCCGGELLLWDEAKQDCIPWSYVETCQDGAAKPASVA